MAESDADVASMKFLCSMGMIVSFLMGSEGTGACKEVKDNRL